MTALALVWVVLVSGYTADARNRASYVDVVAQENEADLLAKRAAGDRVVADC
ncbi:MAG: hypothetical protein R3A47_12165 [Polyangiales bacterium]